MQRRTPETLKILQLIESAGGGGAETVVINLASSRGDKAHVASLRFGWMQKQLEPAGVPCNKLTYGRGGDYILALRLAALARRTKADVVHCHCFTMNIVGALGAALARVPSIGTVHGVTYDLDNKRRRLAYRVAGRLHREIVTVSDFLAQQVSRQTHIPESKIKVIYNGVPASICGPDARRERRIEFGFSDKDFIAGSVGMLRPEKGHADLIRAIKLASEQSPHIRLVLAGEGKCREDLEQLVRDLGIESIVRFAGFRSDVPAVLRAMDAFVLPSHEEGLSIVTIEAMESSVPVIVTDCGGPTEIVANDTLGIVVPPKDPGSIAGAVLKLAGDAHLRETFASNGHARASSAFSIDKMIAEYNSLYARVADI